MEHVYIEHMGNSFALQMGENLVGRDAGCILRLNKAAVSRRHARLIRRQGEVFVEDLGSANGTLLNGRKVVAPIRLHDGDVISIGGCELKVCFTDPLESESTQLIAQLAAAAAEAPTKKIGRRTTEMAIVGPPPLPANERCPRCSAVGSAADKLCGNCNYRWGSEPNEGATSLNRRRHDRVAVVFRVAYASAFQELEATTLDLSENGVFVCSRQLDPVGTPCTVTIFVGDAVLQSRGIVRRIGEPETTHPELVGLGIELTDVGPDERALLISLHERLIKSET